MASDTGRVLGAPLVIRVDALVNFFLFSGVAISFFVFIEPAPYEFLIFLLGGTLLFTGIRVHPLLAVLIALLGIWFVAGAFAVIPVLYNGKSLMYYIVSVYMGVTVLIFALTFAEHTEARLALLVKAYVLAACIASVLGIIGYLGGVEQLMLNGRATATFKDPNVYGPFLILPILFVIQGFIYRGFRIRSLAVALLMLLALFMGFSRGAWGHFVASTLTMVGLMFWTNNDLAFRLRLIRLSVLAAIGVVVMLGVLLSFGSIREMFTERANLVNYYDGGERGRFGNQLQGFLTIFDHPNGMGPKEFYAMFGADPHNVYLASLYAYGWVGGIAYLALTVTTLVIGLKGLLIKAPWQPGLIAVYATFVGVALEGFIIDTDHWRHFFLLMGTVWGLAIASLRYRPTAEAASPAGHGAPSMHATVSALPHRVHMG